MNNYHISRTSIPWKEYKKEPMLGEKLEINSLAGLKEFSELSSFLTNNDPLVAHNPKSQSIVFNSKIFKELIIGDATRLGENQNIGVLTQEGLASVSMRTIAEFLIQTEIIKTYIHIEAFLFMKKENENDSIYRAEFEGSHVYFTNQRNEVRLGFIIEINKETGRITLMLK